MASTDFKINFSWVTKGIQSATRGLNQVNQAVQRNGAAVVKFNRDVSEGQRTLNRLMSQAVTVLSVRALAGYVRTADEARKIQNQLHDALRRTGQATPEYIASLGKQSAALEKLTGIEEEQIQTTQRMLIQFGTTQGNIEELTELTLDFATAMRMDAGSAAQLIAKSLGEDSQNMLTRYGLTLDDTKDRQTGLIEALAAFRGEAEAALTPMQALATASGNLSKELGFVFLNLSDGMSGGLTETLDSLTAAVDKLNTQLEDLGAFGRSVLRGFGAAAMWTLGPLAVLLTAVMALRGAIFLKVMAVNALNAAFVALTGRTLVAHLALVNRLILRYGVMTLRVTTLRQAMLALGTATLFAGAALAGWSLGKFFNELDAGGMKVEDWTAAIIHVWGGWIDRMVAIGKKLWLQLKVVFARGALGVKELVLDLVVSVAEGLNKIPGVDIDIAPMQAKMMQARLEIAKLNSDLRTGTAEIDAELELQLAVREAELADFLEDRLAKPGKKPGGAGAPGGEAGDPSAAARAAEAALKLEEFLLEQSYRRRQISVETYLDRRAELIEKSVDEGAARELAMAQLAEEGLATRLALLQEERSFVDGDYRQAWERVQEEIRSGDLDRAAAMGELTEATGEYVAELGKGQVQLGAFLGLLEEVDDKPGMEAVRAAMEAIALEIRRARNELSDFSGETDKLAASQLALALAKARAARVGIEGGRRSSPDARREALIPALQAEDELLQGQITSDATALQDPGISGEERIELENRLLGLYQQQAEVQNEIWSQQHEIGAAVSDWMDQIGTAGQIAARGVTTVMDGIHGGMQSVFRGLLDGSMELSDVLGNIARSFGSAIADAISRMLADFVVAQGVMIVKYAATKAGMFALDTAFAAKSLALSIAMAAKSVVAWIPAAIAASISSFGVAAAVGLAAVVAGMAAFGGFAAGGYTGAGGRLEAAGVVHKGEVVFDQPAVNRLGVDFLEALRLDQPLPRPLPGYAGGGAVGGGGRRSEVGDRRSDESGSGTSVNIFEGDRRQQLRDFMATDGFKIVMNEGRRRGNNWRS